MTITTNNCISKDIQMMILFTTKICRQASHCNSNYTLYPQYIKIRTYNGLHRLSFAAAQATQRDYLGRVNDPEYPKAKAATLAKQWGFDYWDGDRRICYGGYRYMPGRWEPVASAMIAHYGLRPGDKILDIGCGKGFQLAELKKVMPELEVYGLDISDYALSNAHESVSANLRHGSAVSLPWPDNYFDFCLFHHHAAQPDVSRTGQSIARDGKGGKKE